MPDLDVSIVIIRGAATELQLALKDERDEPETLTSVSEAKMQVRQSMGATAALISGTAVVDVPNSLLKLHVPASDTTNLPLGLLLMDGAVKIGADWYNTDPVYVRVADRVTQGSSPTTSILGITITAPSQIDVEFSSPLAFITGDPLIGATINGAALGIGDFEEIGGHLIVTVAVTVTGQECTLSIANTLAFTFDNGNPLSATFPANVDTTL